ncbi:hypothetical protein NQ315_000287 [Exocentrus adspersus]|uniref:Enoyl reductase (ER) domain-containing protein n=1 Tax=Exocentrus adspersus TaxID=1586481 RepID=A0AAV8VRI6_9CUCU|nr:hypothetical protein NQ315_000287 [Exocentrus adspersus]
MEAVRFTLKTRKLELVKIPVPKLLGEDEVLVKVAYSGFCGTDLHIMQGEYPVDHDKPVTLGHEYSGTVAEVGSSVHDLKKGDRVAVDPNDGCHCCNFCRSGAYHHCADTGAGAQNKIGTFHDGGWAEYAVALRRQVHKLPESITLKQAALTEPISCLTHGWDIVSPINVGERILVLGAGIIGNLWACALHLQGHRKVTVSEPNPVRLELLRQLDTGFDLVTPAELYQRLDAPFYDVVVDCSGNAAAVEASVNLVQKGGKLCCFGVAPTGAEIRLKPFDLYMKEMKIYGVRTNPYSFPKALGLMEAMGDRYLNYDALGVKTLSLGQYNEAIDILKKGIVAKVVFEF